MIELEIEEIIEAICERKKLVIESEINNRSCYNNQISS